MITQFNAALFALAADFTGRYAPYQGIQVAPVTGGGVYVASTDRGAVAFVGFDPDGTADERVVLLPDKEVVKASRGIKTAERTLLVNTDTRLASVTTHRKTKDDVVELVAPALSAQAFPPLEGVLATCVEHWNNPAPLSTTAGRYEATLLRKLIAAAEGLGESVILSGFAGGPLRIEVEGSTLILLIMPQTAEPIPPAPPWLLRLNPAATVT